MVGIDTLYTLSEGSIPYVRTPCPNFGQVKILIFAKIVNELSVLKLFQLFRFSTASTFYMACVPTQGMCPNLGQVSELGAFVRTLGMACVRTQGYPVLIKNKNMIDMKHIFFHGIPAQSGKLIVDCVYAEFAWN